MNDKKKQFIGLVSCLTLLALTLNLSAQDAEIYREPLTEFKNVPSGAIYNDPSKSAEERTADVVKRLTFEELTSLFGGDNGFHIAPISRLGLRPIKMTDAGQGLRFIPADKLGDEQITPDSTSYPAGLAAAATWQPQLMNLYGASVGEECRLFGIDILLGPGLNMQRLSTGGRNFEYLGEDPLLASEMITEYVKGLQGKHIIATAKHFVGNDQEFVRHMSDVHIDERTLREIYLPPWKAAIQRGGLKAIMAGNNALNGVPGSMDEQYVQHVLRDEWGFTGIAMTDWQNSYYYPEKQYLFLNSGMTLLMPNSNTFDEFLPRYLNRLPQKKAEVTEILRTKAYANLLPVFQSGLYDIPVTEPSLKDEMAQHKINARLIAEEAITLLKNQDNILPLSAGTKILLMGEQELTTGRGSGYVKGYDHVNFADGLKSVFKSVVENTDFDVKQIQNADVVIYRLNVEGAEGKDIPFETGMNDEIAKVAALNPNVVVIISSANGLPMPWLDKAKAVIWGYFLGQERGNAIANVVSGKVNPSGKLPFTLETDFNNSNDPDFNHIGGKPFWQGTNKFYRSYWVQDGGEINASSQIKDNLQPHQAVTVNYDEGVFMGYRWWDKTGGDIYFPFGHGLSYTTFDYSDLKISDNEPSGNEVLTVSVTLKNTGKRKGKEVVQLYVSDKKSSVERPLKELRRFEKVTLKTGQSKTVSFVINKQDLAFWDINKSEWTVEPGEFELWIGSSSADIRLKKLFLYQ